MKILQIIIDFCPEIVYDKLAKYGIPEIRYHRNNMKEVHYYGKS